MGLAGVRTSWQRQTKHFGHDRGDQYSVLVLDNRGIGRSDKPVGRYSTSEMARDVLEVLDHVGWTANRSVNLVGISMGGMIAQEIACLAPTRLMSLSLCCSSAGVMNDKGLLQTVRERFGMLVPKSVQQTIDDTADQLFTREWLRAPDCETLPVPGTTPRCSSPTGSSDSYALFDSNFQRFQAQELAKRLDNGGSDFSLPGFLCQLVAAGFHAKTDAQLRAMADAVGRERVLVMHGTRDNMIALKNGEALINVLEPGVGLIEEGMGHAPPMERAGWFNGVLEERLGVWSKL